MLCKMCPNECKIDRNLSVGACGENNEIRIAKYYLHPFEEPLVSGSRGSGTIFFCGGKSDIEIVRLSAISHGAR